MSNYKYHYTSNDLSLNQAHNYHLLLQIDTGSFSYAIVYQKQLLAWATGCPLTELTRPHELRDILSAGYQKIITGHTSDKFTLLPGSFFDKDRIAEIARLLDVQHDEMVYHQTFDSENVIIYVITPWQQEAAMFNHENTNFYAKGWIKAIAATQPANTHLYLNTSGETVEFLYFLNNKLRFYNTFKFKDHVDLAYFCAFVTREIKLPPEKTILILSGDINEADQGFTYLADFFSEVKLNYIQILELPEQVKPHQILTLAALSLCASSEEV